MLIKNKYSFKWKMDYHPGLGTTIAFSQMGKGWIFHIWHRSEMLKEFRFQSQGAKVNCILPIHFDKMQTFLSNLGWTRSGSFHSKSYSCLTFCRFGMSLSAITSFEFNLRSGQYSETNLGKMLWCCCSKLYVFLLSVL